MKTSIWSKKHFVIMLTITACFGLINFPDVVHAYINPWSGEIKISTEKGVTEYTGRNRCLPTNTAHVIENSVNFDRQFQELCYYQKPGWRYGYYYMDSYRETVFVISLDNSDIYHAVPSLKYPTVPYGEDSSKLLFSEHDYGTSRFDYYLINNLRDELIRDYTYDGRVYYSTFQKSGGVYRQAVFTKDKLVGERYGLIKPTGIRAGAGVGMSADGRFIVREVPPYGIVMVDTSDNTLNWILNVRLEYGQGNNPSLKIQVTKDGNHVLVYGNNVVPEIFSTSERCRVAMLDFSDTSILDATHAATCPSSNGNLAKRLIDGIGNNLHDIFYIDLSDDASTITAVNINSELSTAEGAFYDATTLSISSSDQTVGLRLDYLALGDSFSSGEGDTAKDVYGKKYYRNHTDDEGLTEYTLGGYKLINPREKCHISTRSYPYLLARDNMNLALDSPKQWDTVACSGATAWDVKELGSKDYLGQNNANVPRLEGFDAAALKATALNEYIPGRQKQIEFVKKYQPKVITLMMGGNDVDFGGKLHSCSTSISVCDWAKPSFRDRLYYNISHQFENLSSLYSEISKATDGKSKIYVVGYPVFINGNPYTLCSNVYNLDKFEREMINNSVIYMNNVIQQAAKKAGVKYISIENSFGNHRLCDTGTQHVTAITGVQGYNGNNEQESFHPNSLGHADMAASISKALNGKSMLEYNTCPDETKNVCPDENVQVSDAIVPPYFTASSPSNDDGTQIWYYTLTNGTLVKMTERYDVDSQNFKFASETKVDLTLYSDPTPLGQFSVATDGSVNAQITIPSSVPAGYHTLVLRGTGVDGKPQELYQTVEVRGSNPKDIDEDGITDSADKCIYIMPLNIDADKDGVDDACDPEVNIPERPYRVRLGDSARLYAGLPEKENYLYIERRVVAINETGISGDDDPDGDGWAIIGASEGREHGATSVPDTAPYARFAIDSVDVMGAQQLMPSVYIRAGDYGCVRYRPETMAKVEPGQVRKLTLVTGSTNTCRAEPPEADMDHDGHPDNTQPLYSARNGDPSKGEDPTRTYLLRNFYAAEAQLGISDYTPTGTPAGRPTKPIQPWNILATSKDVGYSPLFNNLTTIKDTAGNPIPYISARKHNKDNPSSNICITYRPDTTNQIQLTTQPIRQLQILKWKDVPEGVGCE